MIKIASQNREFKLLKTKIAEVDRSPYFALRKTLKEAIQQKLNQVITYIHYSSGEKTCFLSGLEIKRSRGQVFYFRIGCQNFLDAEARKLYRWAVAK